MKGFIDQLNLTVASGNGAPGAVSFRREKFVPKGGPDGGDGGNGGNIIFIASKKLSSLSHLYSLKIIKANDGQAGSGVKKKGKNGDSKTILLPVGSILKDQLGNLIVDFNEDGESFLFLKGGKGGRGNASFANSQNQAPLYAQKGIKGSQVDVFLELKLIADIGLVGLPNVGKSTFIASITNAKPKIANYPFTTLSPHLGIYNINIEKQLIIADIPGIIEGAHTGKGLGLYFLKHIERTSFLFFIIESLSKDPHTDFKKIKKEINSYSKELSKRPFAIGISKSELITDKEKLINKFSKVERSKLFFFSSLTKEGLKEFQKIGYEVLSLKEKKKVI